MSFMLKTREVEFEIEDGEEVFVVGDEVAMASLANDYGLIVSKPELTDPDRYRIAFDHDLRVDGTYDQVYEMMNLLDRMKAKPDR